MISTVVVNVDGVLNTGQCLYDIGGKKYKVFGSHDLEGIQVLREHEVEVVAISSDLHGWGITERRCNELGIELLRVNELDRTIKLMEEFEMPTTLFIGDGHYDAMVMPLFGFSAAPANACQAALRACRWRLRTRGGEGVMLEVATRLTKPSMWQEWRGWRIS